MMNNIDFAGLAQMFSQALPVSNSGSRQLWAIDKASIRDSSSQVSALRGQDGKVPQSSRRGVSYGPGTYMTRVGSIAIVPIMGPLVSRMSYWAWSYDEVIRDIRLAVEDNTIDAIMLDVDSPGGMVANVEAAAQEILKARAAKPVVAFVGGIGASAAYWLSACASEVVAAPTSLVGSVGCLIRYLDMEGIFTKLGARKIEVVADQSPNKSLDAESEEGRAELQAIVDNGAELFLEGLIQSRGVSRETLVSNYGGGLVFTAQEALTRGLVDKISSLEDTLTDLADRAAQTLTHADAATASSDQEKIMAEAKDGAAPVTKNADKVVTVESLRADHGDMIASIEKDAEDRGAKKERDRISGIQALSVSGHEALVAELIADANCSVGDAAQKILAEVKTSSVSSEAKTLNANDVLRKMDAAAEGVSSSVSSGDGEVVANTPEDWKAEWESSDKLKAEYPTSDSYVATKKREALKAA